MAQILVIDDEPDVRESMQVVLSRSGHAVRTAPNALDGIGMCRVLQPDLLITDIIMPESHGFEAITQIRKDFPSVRIIAISGGGNYWPADYQPESVTTTAYLAAASRFGADAVLAKPFDRATLLALVEKLVSLPRGGRPN